MRHLILSILCASTEGTLSSVEPTVPPGGRHRSLLIPSLSDRFTNCPASLSSMAKGKRSATRKRHNARKWILSVFAATPSPKRLRTSQILSKVSSLSGAKIPAYSVYQALRTLVKKRQLSSSRQGRELTFTQAGGPSSAPARPAPAVDTSPTSMVDAGAKSTAASGALVLPHTLAPGEISILHVSDGHVEAATNVHGKLVLERHRRPTS